MGLLVAGVSATFAHQFFFNMYSEPHDVCSLVSTGHCFSRETGEGWCYVSWFWYLDTIKYCVAAILCSVGLILFVPPKYSLSFIPFSMLQAAGWTYLIHFTFFTESHETINSIPHWSIISIGVALGFSIIMSADYLLYWFNHKALGNWQRFAGLSEMDLPADVKEPMYKQLAKEFREVNRMI